MKMLKSLSAAIFLAIAISIIITLCSGIAAADTSASLPADCTQLCVQEKWEEATKCFRQSRDPPAAYLATATCAFNNNKDDIAEQYALKSAKSRNEWATFLNRFGYTFINTGGLGETYVLAYVASGGSRHEQTAKNYLKTSGQCRRSDDAEVCAEQYFNSVVARYQSRNIQSARVSYTGSAKTLTGTVTDHYGKPLKHAKVNYKCGAKDNIVYTDDSGVFRISFGDVMSTSEACTNGKLFVKFTYTVDEKVYFRILFNNKEATVWRTLNINNDADLVQNFELKNTMTSPQYQAEMNLLNIADYGVIYTHMAEAVEYYKDFLKADIDYKLPVDVIPHQTAKHTCYAPSDSTIYIHYDDSDVADSDRPRNREYHEFSHHVMYSMYTTWPKAKAGLTPATKNHAGYINPSTSDSYLEGFAEFMAVMIANHYSSSAGSAYPTCNNIERNLKIWEYKGKAEEYAIAGILWDMYDISSDEQLQMKFEDIWSVIRQYSADFSEVYTDFVTRYPNNKELFDKIFELHGFWADKTRGNGIRDRLEPYIDNSPKNNAYNLGEYFVDYESGARKPEFTKQGDEKIGLAASYNRSARRNAVQIEGCYIKVDNDVPQYDVKFSCSAADACVDQVVDNDNGLIHVLVPLEGATVTITPKDVAYRTPLVIKSTDFAEAFPEADDRGYYVEHDFGITGQAKPPVKDIQDVSGIIPYYEWDGEAKPEDYEYHAPKDTGWGDESGMSLGSVSGGSSLKWIIAIVALAAVLGGFYLYKKNSNKKAKHRNKKEKKSD